MHKLFRIILIINLLLIIDLHQLNAEILVGVSAPLSGDVGEYGNAVRNGIELARKENLENKNVKFFFEDNKFSASATISVFNKLVNYNKVQLIYNWGEMPLQAVAPIAEQRKIPIVAMSLDPEPILDKKYIIGSINHSTQFAKLVTDYLKKNNLKKIALIKAEEPFFNSMHKGLSENLAEDQTLDVVFSCLPDEKDFKTAISILAKSDYDMIGVYLYPGQVSTFFRQMNAMNLKISTFGTDIFQSRTEIKHALGAMEGAVYPNSITPENFLKTYTDNFNNDLQVSFAYNAYIFAKLVFEQFGDKDSIFSNEEILAKLKNPSLSDSFPFKVNQSEEGVFYDFPLQLEQIVDGKPTPMR